MISAAQIKKPSKLPKPKSKRQQPLKVVYISNPVRVNTSASQFRALVQKLTGQDSDIANFSALPENMAVASYNDHLQEAPARPASTVLDVHDKKWRQDGFDIDRQPYGPVDDLEEVFSSNYWENLGGFVPCCSSLCYEPHFDVLLQEPWWMFYLQGFVGLSILHVFAIFS